MSLDPQGLDVLGTFKQVQEIFRKDQKTTDEAESFEDEGVEHDVVPEEHRVRLLTLIRALPPGGFERLSQRLLRESGFQQVVVTGRSGDGGIDGIGVFQVNAFVSFKVFFQCKRYQGAVTPAQVRDFRGAMMGRTDKGIIITTGTFTLEAKREARRDGVPPIELVDSELLVQMFEQLQLGLIPRTTYDVDENFFEDFKL